jgi:hypothetical protein
LSTLVSGACVALLSRKPKKYYMTPIEVHENPNTTSVVTVARIELSRSLASRGETIARDAFRLTLSLQMRAVRQSQESTRDAEDTPPEKRYW